MWFEIQPRSPDLIIIPHWILYKSYSLNRTRNESKAVHLHFYAKINGFSLVKKALRRPQNTPNCTIYFKMFRGGDAPWPPKFILNPHSFQCTPSYSSLTQKTTTLDFNTEIQILIWIKPLDSRMNIYTLVHVTMINSNIMMQTFIIHNLIKHTQYQQS